MVNLIKIEILKEMTKYEDPRTSEIHHSDKKWTRGVPIILVDKDGKTIVTDHWVYLNHNDELVYNKKESLVPRKFILFKRFNKPLLVIREEAQ
ncbi:hypothetical protein [Brevibacillus laterosporus]|uniref:Uncharacterized protein n=1 Tax=Brevibacillus laterosporus TaxID=1465 RepID=A0A0F6Y012_BRELA|nr:hypothetical protein EX87_14570 [Brevibacillus laterosporus]